MARPQRVTLLGALAIGSNVAAGLLPGRRPELTFAFLAAEHHRLVARDELADALWPGGLPPTWSAAMRVVIAQVRRFLREAGWDDTALVTMRSGFQLTLPGDTETDLDLVRARTELATERLDAGDPAGAVEAAAFVTERAALPFLPEHDGEWVEQIRRQLRRSLARVLAAEATARAALGDGGASMEAAARLVEVDPLSELAHRLRIRLLAQSGDAAGAARAFDECRAVLGAELGVEPTAETAAARWTEPARAVEVPVGPDPTARPVATCGADPIEQRAASWSGASLSQLGVLVVEDHDFQRRTLVQVLESIGVGWVESVADGTDALDRLGSSPQPDLVLCDIDMPRMDGVEFVRHLGAQGRGTAVAFTSALEPAMLRSVETLSVGYGLEVLGALPKPITARRLRDLLAGFTPRPETGSTAEVGDRLTPDDLRKALGAAEVTARFRPRLDLATGGLSAAVITPWWERRTGQPVVPGVVDDLAAQGGLENVVTDELLRRAARLLNNRSASSVPRAVVIHLPRASLSDVGLVDHWVERLKAQRLEAQRIVASVDLVDNPGGPAVLDALTRLRLKGFEVSLHGFDGSLMAQESVARLPLTGITVAGRLVSGAAGSSYREDRLERVLDTARALGLPVVADGCDHQEDLAMLLALGCLEAQGAFIGPLMPASELGRWAAGDAYSAQSQP